MLYYYFKLLFNFLLFLGLYYLKPDFFVQKLYTVDLASLNVKNYIDLNGCRTSECRVCISFGGIVEVRIFLIRFVTVIIRGIVQFLAITRLIRFCISSDTDCFFSYII